jgi:hypothetical protein
MSNSASRLIDLDALKHALSPGFDEYDAAVSVGDDKQCKQARKRIMRQIDAAIVAAVKAPQGIYLFADLKRDGMDGLTYIGCAHKRDFKKRLDDYLVRDVSGLDLRLSERSEADAKAIIDKRISATMPRTAAMTRSKYVDGHWRTMRLTRGGALLVSSMDDASLVTAVEAQLICTAWASGARLENKECRWPKPALMGLARERALAVLSEWESLGLPSQTVSIWSNALGKLAV